MSDSDRLEGQMRFQDSLRLSGVPYRLGGFRTNLPDRAVGYNIDNQRASEAAGIAYEDMLDALSWMEALKLRAKSREMRRTRSTKDSKAAADSLMSLFEKDKFR